MSDHEEPSARAEEPQVAEDRVPAQERVAEDRVPAQERVAEERVPTERWRRLPERVDPAGMVASHETDPPPGNPPAAFDPDTSWMLRYS